MTGLAVQAQDVIWKMTYDAGIPFGTTKEYADQVSWRGLSLDMDRFVSDNFALGIGFSWNVFLEKESDSDYQLGGMLLHGTQVRYLNNMPLTARASWYQPLDALELFGAVGLGSAWHEERTEIGTLAITTSAWQFVLAPEVGFIFPVGMGYATAKVKYVQGFKTESVPDMSYLSIGLGLAW